uniref:Retrovirus-related Pol polyprotein from transposon TNT 1-94 n=1 Tax=Nicotiana tabacum TaxID=4097 RepID=A0A1S3XXB5_TOBAC|nr:PREDICTED: uncharacterized protein LOC107769838 [Nicotiana tabacum]
MVCGCGLNHHIDGSEPIPTQFLDQNMLNLAYKVWVREDQLVLSWIVASVSENIRPQLVGAETARAAWDKLVVAYASGSKPLIRELKMQLHTLRHDNASIEAYVQNAKGIADRLAALQHLIHNDDFVEFVLAGLGPAYRPFTRSLVSHQEDIMFDALYGILLNEERQLKIDETINVIAPTSQFTQSSISTTRGRGKGHIARVCPSPRANSISVVSSRPTSNLASSPNPPIQSWLMDNGITHHLTADLDNLGFDNEKNPTQESSSGDLYSLPVLHSSSPASYAASLGVWHARLDHASYPTVHHALPSNVLASSSNEYPSLCSTCDVSKSHKLPFKESSFKDTGPLDLVCSDVWGAAPVASKDGYRYYVILFYHFSKYT